MAYTVRLPVPVADEWDWQLQAACRGMDLAAFFHPPGERGPAWRRREEQAKKICAGCPVAQQCLEYALRIEEPFGTWGGVGERERWNLVQRQRAQRPRRRGTPTTSQAHEVMPDHGKDRDDSGA